MKIATNIKCVIFIKLMHIKYIAIKDIISICDKIPFKIIFNIVNFFKVSLLIFDFLNIFSPFEFFEII